MALLLIILKLLKLVIINTLYYLSIPHACVGDIFNVIVKEYRLSNDGCYYYASDDTILLKALKDLERILAESLTIIG